MSVSVAAPHDAGLDRDWVAVAAATCGLIFSVGTLTIYSFGVFVHPLAASFHWSRTQLAGAVAVSQIGLALASPLWGVMLDRLGPRAVLLGSIALMSLLFGSLSLLEPPLWHLYLAFAALPFVAAGASPLGYSAVLVRRFERHLGLALGLATMGVGLGAAILPPLAQGLVGGFGWRRTFLLLGVIAFLIGIPASVLATRHASGPVAREIGVALPLGPALRTRTFPVLCLVFALLGCTTVGVLGQIVPMMVDRGFPPAAAARMAGLTGLAALVGRGGIGAVLDRLPAPRVLAVVALLAAASFLLLGTGHGQGASYAAVVLLGASVGAEVNFIAYLIRRHFVQALFGRVYGLVFGAYIVSGGLGQIVLGASVDHLGGYRPSLLLFTAFAVVAAALTIGIPARRWSDRSAESGP